MLRVGESNQRQNKSLGLVWVGLFFSILSIGDSETLSETQRLTQWNSNQVEVHTVKLQSDDKILVAGTLSKSHDKDFAIFRYDENNVLDTSFGIQGVIITDFGQTDDIPVSIYVKKDKRIVVRGYSCTENKDRCTLTVAQYLPDGKLDLDFGDGGTLLSKVSGQSTPEDIYFNETPRELELSASFCDRDTRRCISKFASYTPTGKFLRITEAETFQLASFGG